MQTTEDRKTLTGLRGLMQAMGIGRSQALEVDSTAIASVRYDRKRMSLTVNFNQGTAYEYGSVPAATYRELAKSESKGRFFVSSIRNDFPFRRVV